MPLVCPFCETEVVEFHKRSHILPEWMHEGVYDEKGKAIKIELKNPRVAKTQSGEYRSFICEKCEVAFCPDDRYGSLILARSSPETPEVVNLKITEKPVGDHSYLEMTGFNFKRLQNFVFSIVLRGHLAGFYNISDKHFKKMRELYKSDVIDDNLYPIVIYKIQDGDPLEHFVAQPHKGKDPDGHHTITFIAAGFHVVTYISSHPKDDTISTIKLKIDGPLYMVNVPTEGSPIRKQLTTAIKQANTKIDPQSLKIKKC